MLMMTKMMMVFSMAVGPHIDDDADDGFQHGGWI